MWLLNRPSICANSEGETLIPVLAHAARVSPKLSANALRNHVVMCLRVKVLSYSAVQPPSMLQFAPVTLPASSRHRNTAKAPISCG